jgi:SAM-dependent methyltransferase
MADNDRWQRYFKHTQGRPPRRTLLFALDRFDAEGLSGGTAIDLGCGGGRDTVELLRRGWRVLALDGEPDAVRAVRRLAEERNAAIDARVWRFEDIDALPPADLVNASFCLPFCAPESVDALWEAIRSALRPGGRFAGQLLGPHDTWVRTGEAWGVSAGKLARLTDGYAVERDTEEEDDAVTPSGRPKHWHIHHLVLKRLV